MMTTLIARTITDVAKRTPNREVSKKTLRVTLSGCVAIVALALFVAGSPAAPVIPAPPQSQPIAIVGARIYPVTSDVIECGTIVLDQGRITAVGGDVAVPENAHRIEAQGKHVYPALFNACGNLGLVEIDAVRATRDTSESGQINPNVKAQVAVNPDSELIPVTRSNGVLLTLTVPEGGLVRGTSAVLQLDGWTWEDLTLHAPAAMHITWPAMHPVIQWWMDQPPDEQRRQRDEQLDNLEDFFRAARDYAKSRQASSSQPVDVRYEAMLPVLNKQLPVMVHADWIEQIQAAVAFCQRHDLKMILCGGYDAPDCQMLLRQLDIPVIVEAVYRLPLTRGDAYDTPFTLPHRLHQAGIRYCIAGGGRFGASNLRNLPYHAAMAAAYGLDRHEALKAITLYPAQILGVDHLVGSLQPGKQATLIVTDGDILETPTQVQRAFIQGRELQLTDRHKQLWQKYQEKYRR